MLFDDEYLDGPAPAAPHRDQGRSIQAGQAKDANKLAERWTAFAQLQDTAQDLGTLTYNITTPRSNPEARSPSRLAPRRYRPKPSSLLRLNPACTR
ncbi:MAG: hypothetical protein IPH26_03530 [Sterolibacteriaceae bacterium]|uniref:Uncharacterized protein n=1 Tax=Candidatus Methylophosphatis roskildensis TaxID=2899263 RepID=A0A9D7HKW7_9PROT|nr:hypothetical protein [Candidatus Methylophosphatis roskildensis]